MERVRNFPVGADCEHCAFAVYLCGSTCVNGYWFHARCLGRLDAATRQSEIDAYMAMPTKRQNGRPDEDLRPQDFPAA